MRRELRDGEEGKKMRFKSGGACETHTPSLCEDFDYHLQQAYIQIYIYTYLSIYYLWRSPKDSGRVRQRRGGVKKRIGKCHIHVLTRHDESNYCVLQTCTNLKKLHGKLWSSNERLINLELGRSGCKSRLSLPCCWQQVTQFFWALISSRIKWGRSWEYISVAECLFGMHNALILVSRTRKEKH